MWNGAGRRWVSSRPASPSLLPAPTEQSLSSCQARRAASELRWPMAARAAAGGLAHGGLTAGPPPLLPLCRSQHLCRDLLPSTMTHQWLRGLQVLVLGLALPPLISHDRSLASQPALPLPPPLQKRDKQRPIPMPCALQVRVAWGRLCFFFAAAHSRHSQCCSLPPPVQYAKNSRAACAVCRRTIPEGALRLGTGATSGEWRSYHWHHM